MTEGDRLTLHSLSRSSNDSALPEVIAALDAAARLAGGELEVKHNYGGWRPDLDSPALAALHASYEGLFGEEPIVDSRPRRSRDRGDRGQGARSRHDLLRPADRGARTRPTRGCSIPTVERFWRLLVAFVDELSKPGKDAVMRGGWLWVVVILAGVVAVTGVVALVGRDDNKDQTVSAGEWADSVCGSVAVWRGEIESIVDEIRQPSATGFPRSEEPQSETPQGRTGFDPVGSRAHSARHAHDDHRESRTPASPTRRRASRPRTRSPGGPTRRGTTSRTRRTRSTTRRTPSRTRSRS